MKYLFITTQNQTPTGKGFAHILMQTEKPFFGGQEISKLTKEFILDKNPQWRNQYIGEPTIIFFKELSKEEFEYYNEN